MKNYTEKEIDSIVAWAKTEAWRVLIQPLKKASDDPQKKHEPICVAPGESIIDLKKNIDSEVAVITLHPGNVTFYGAIDRLYRLKELVEQQEGHMPETGV